jgi:hypothetical protein
MVTLAETETAMTAQKTPVNTAAHFGLIRTRALLAAGGGLVALIIGMIVGHIKVGISGYGSVSALQANQLCSTGIGSLVQGFDSTVSSACSTAGTVASVHGVLIDLGWVLLLGGLISAGLAAWAGSQGPAKPATAPQRAAFAAPEVPEAAPTDSAQPQ